MISIITPHFNNSDGLQNIYKMLCSQTKDAWQWIIVDDCSKVNDVIKIKAFFNNYSDSRVQIIFNDEKTSSKSMCWQKTSLKHS